MWKHTIAVAYSHPYPTGQWGHLFKCTDLKHYRMIIILSIYFLLLAYVKYLKHPQDPQGRPLDHSHPPTSPVYRRTNTQIIINFASTHSLPRQQLCDPQSVRLIDSAICYLRTSLFYLIIILYIQLFHSDDDAIVVAFPFLHTHSSSHRRNRSSQRVIYFSSLLYQNK